MIDFDYSAVAHPICGEEALVGYQVLALNFFFGKVSAEVKSNT